MASVGALRTFGTPAPLTLSVEIPLSPAATDCSWPIVRIRKDGVSVRNQPEAATSEVGSAAVAVD